MEVLAPLENDPLLSGRSIRLLRHLELQNPSIISDFRNRDRMVQEKVRSSRSSSRRNGKHFYRIGYITQVTTTYYITTLLHIITDLTDKEHIT